VSVRSRWRAIRAPLLLGTAVMSLVLGTIGYLQLTSVTPPYGFLDALYGSITLFAFGGTAPPPIPVTLQIARITAPVLTGYAALGTVLALTRSQARVLGIRLFIRNHVIICGLGQTGGRLAAALIDQTPVVVIESNTAARQIAGARLRGVSILGGDASDPALLRQAGIQRARTVVVACGSAAVNVDVAAATSRALTEPRARPLRVFADLDNLDLWASLAAEDSTFPPNDPTSACSSST
jgi:TrkA-N domain